MFSYKSVVMFGGCHDDWMLVVKQRYQNPQTQLLESQTKKYLFAMSTPKVRLTNKYLFAMFFRHKHVVWTLSRNLSREKSSEL